MICMAYFIMHHIATKIIAKKEATELMLYFLRYHYLYSFHFISSKPSIMKNNNESENTRINYYYRDASNYKFATSVVLNGELSALQIHNIENKCQESKFFLPEQVGLDTVFNQLIDKGYSFPTEDDHPWHTLSSITSTESEPTEDISANDFYDLFTAIECWDEERYGLEIDIDECDESDERDESDECIELRT